METHMYHPKKVVQLSGDGQFLNTEHKKVVVSAVPYITKIFTTFQSHILIRKTKNRLSNLSIIYPVGL